MRPLWFPVAVAGNSLALALAVNSLLLALPAAAQTGSAEWRAPLPQAEMVSAYASGEIHSVDFLNRHEGWAVGHSRTATLIFRTVDGGESWDRLPLFDGQTPVPRFKAVRFADPRNGWIAGGSQVLRTRDGGESWEPVEVPGHIAANTLLVLGPDAVMIGSDSRNGSQIQVTTDGGRTWRMSTVSGHGNDNVVSLAFTSPDRFFAVTSSAFLNRGGLYRSRDGGRNWEPVIEGEQPLRGVAFTGDRGVVVGDAAYWSDDGGESWRRTTAQGNRFAVHFLDGDHVIAVGENPGVVVSEDGGRSWQAASSPNPRGRLEGVGMVDPGWFYLAGGYGANALFHFVDPFYAAPVAQARLPLPHHVRLPDGTVLPRGVYDVLLAHRGEEHVVWLGLRSDPAPGDPNEMDEAPEGVPACEDPCSGSFAVDFEYSVEDAPAEPGSDTTLSFDPTSEGVAIVVDAVLGPPQWLGTALAALGAPEQELDAPAAERVRGGDVAEPAVFRIRLRHMLDLFPPDDPNDPR